MQLTYSKYILMKKITLLFLLFGLLSSYAQTNILTEDFESASLTTPPAGWTTSSNGVGWKFGNNLGSQYWAIPSHTKYAASNDDAAGNSNDGSVDYLISPVLDLSPYTAVFLKFSSFFNGAYHETATLEGSSDGGNTWNLIYTVSPADDWQELIVPLGNLAGQSNVKIRFHANDEGYWASGFAVDDVLIYEPVAYDVALISINTANYVISGNTSITGTLTNLGQTNLTEVDVMWSIDGGTNFTTDHLSGLNVAPGASYDFTHSTPIDMSATHGYNVMVKLANPNNNTDENLGDNTLTKLISSLSQIPTKRIVGEEAGGTWCGWCPRGLVALKDMEHYYPNNWIGIAVHNGDPMQQNEYNNALTSHRGSNSFPGGMIDRKGGDIDPGDFSDVFQERSSELTPVEIDFNNINWDSASNELSFDVTATFYTNFTGDFRINAIITEDNVHGTSSDWGQHNYYSNQYNLIDWEGINWKNLPSTVPASDMVYNHVGRSLLGGWDGSPNSIPSTITNGTVYSQHYSYTVPSTSDINNINIVGIVIDQNNGNIINGNKTSLNFTGIENNAFVKNINIYPNPNNGQFTIKNVEGIQIDIYNVVGTRVYHEIKSPLNIQIDLKNLAKGIYIAKFSKNAKTGIKKILINK